MLFYVMPFVEGESLRALLDRESQLPLEDALRTADRRKRSTLVASGSAMTPAAVVAMITT